MLDTPVLFIVFNRLDTVKEVFSRIQAAKPSRLYISSDGPRNSRNGEADKVQVVRDYINANINWPCEVHTKYNESNKGCKIAVSEAITWFFETEEMGIILEDDCLPSLTFFTFCDELLRTYCDDERIWMISGFNALDGKKQLIDSYVFSNFGFCWGWATWKRAWNHFDVDMKLWPTAIERGIINTYPFFPLRNNEWQSSYNGEIDTWDYQWYFTVASNNGLAVVPSSSLIKNIGFGPDATHTFMDVSGRGRIDEKEMVFPLDHPPFIFYDKTYDETYLRMATKQYGLITRIMNFLKKKFNYA